MGGASVSMEGAVAGRSQRWWTALGMAVATVGCAPAGPIDHVAPRTSATTAPTARASTQVIPEEPPSVPAGAVPSSAPVVAAPAASSDFDPATRTPAGPGEIGCGSGRCRAGEEVCCGESCAPRGTGPLWGPAPNGNPGVELRVCDGDVDLIACDDSGDCGAGERCCRNHLGYLSCTPTSRGACENHEVCLGSNECRSPGATCHDGRCVRETPRVACGDTRCTDATPICCLHPTTPQCVARDTKCPGSAGDSVSLECRTGADCLRGERCCFDGASTRCAGGCNDGSLLPTCTRSADCRGAALGGSHRSPIEATVCGPHPTLDLRTCMTPEDAKAIQRLRGQRP